MNSYFHAILTCCLLLCGCNAFNDPLRPIANSNMLGENWETASIEEHAFVLTPLKIADDAPDEYRSLLASSRRTKDAGGREILTVAGGRNCPEHTFILDRAKGKMVVSVNLDGSQSKPIISTYLRQIDGWHYIETPVTPLDG